jgi:HAD superfamily hydrolase (TIGR01450 family)
MTADASEPGRGTRLGACPEGLPRRYDVAMLDLDGVVYIGPDAVPGAADQLSAARDAGLTLGFVTNNASRPPASVADHLRELGIAASAGDVVTSAQAAAHLVSDRVPAGAAVFVIGGEGLFAALDERGLRPVQSIDDEPQAVVSGYHPDLRWRTVIDGAILVRDGLPWVASNTDSTVPTAHGPGPGNGVLVGVVADFAGRTPVVAGKPRPPLLEETLQRVGGQRPLVVGDRLDTDIEGAVNAGYDSLLVMTGVTGLAELVAAAPGSRPTYVAATLAGLVEEHPAPEQAGPAPSPPDPTPAHPAQGDPTWRCGGWEAQVAGGRLEVRGEGRVDDWWRVVAAAAWSWTDDTGEVPDITGLAAPEA